MTNRRAKIAASATVLGLGALGGVALGTNHGVPVATQQVAASAGSAPVVTSASGATAAPAGQTIAIGTRSSTRPPIVTRASGAGALRGAEFDD
jgi:hypothetical protein